MGSFWVTCLVLSTMGLLGSALTPSSFVSSNDKLRLGKVFSESLAKKDISSIAFGILGSKLLGDGAISDVQSLCQKLQNYLDGSDVTISAISQAAAAVKELQKCNVKLGTKASEVVNTALASDGSVGDLYYAAMTQISLGQTVDKAKIAKDLAAALKKDDGITSLGYAFNLAAHLDAANGDVKSVFDRIEDALVQADEIDGKILQFEGGLSATHFVVHGCYKLAEKLGKVPPLSKTQAVKFANYFLSRKSVQSPKRAYYLLQTLQTMANNKFHIPVSVTLKSQSFSVSKSNPKIQVEISDLVGKSLGKMDVEVESAMRITDGAVILSKSKMTQVAGDEKSYEIDIFKANPGRGFYELTITASPAKKDDRLVGNVGAMLTIKSLSEISVEDVEFGIADADGSIPPKVQKLAHPNKLGSVAAADQHQKVTLKFSVKDKVSGDKIKVHQSFVSLVNVASGSEIVFVAESSEDNVYSFELDVSKSAKDFGFVSGKYRANLIVGDAVVSNPVSWNLADIDLTFPETSTPKESGEKSGVLPEIKHLFREPEKRPAALISNGFTILCLLPIAFMLIGWGKLGVNLSNFPYSLTAIGFHIGLGAIFSLYYCFWLNLDMFTTIKYLIMLGVVTFLCGNSMLARIADKRKNL